MDDGIKSEMLDQHFFQKWPRDLDSREESDIFVMSSNSNIGASKEKDQEMQFNSN